MVNKLWFAFKLVSLSHWIQLKSTISMTKTVVICFQISIFEPLNTASRGFAALEVLLWFAFKLVSLSHWIQQKRKFQHQPYVVICFQISIFEPLNTAETNNGSAELTLWFAFKLVSLSHWIQRRSRNACAILVVICFQISIFEPLNTAGTSSVDYKLPLWFAFKLVSLSHWIQPLLQK